MAAAKLHPDALHAFLDAGHSQAEAAIEFGVSEAAISQRVKHLHLTTSKVVALERAADVVDQRLSAADGLRDVHEVVRDH
jgi:hypothetical protein